MKRWLLPLIALMLLSACQSSLRTGQKWRHGTSKQKTQVRFNGLSRSYLLHIPKNPPEKKWPLIVVLHGAFSTAKEMEKQSGFSTWADERGFCVAYPNGIGLFGKLQHWNAGHCCGKAAKDNVDDVAFIDAVINHASSVCPIDPERIYLVGYSNGGMMAYRYAEERTDRIAAVAIVSGAINSTAEDTTESWTLRPPTRPIPLLIIHGKADDIVPWLGGESPKKANGRHYASLQTAADFWQKNNGPHAPVQIELLAGWGHMWPGPFFTDRENTPAPLRGYDGAKGILDFFEQHMPPR